jgi:hypothetical protein
MSIFIYGCNSAKELEVNRNVVDVKESKTVVNVIPDTILNKCIKPQNSYELIPSLNSNKLDINELTNAYMIIYSNYTNCYMVLKEIKTFQENNIKLYNDNNDK